MVLVQSPPEHRMVLHGISWETYERLLADHENKSAPRFTYDRGTLEIMSPLPEHEGYRRAVESLMDALAVEIDITHSSLDKLPVYAQFGVSEVWRYDGERLEILLLHGDRYVGSRESRAIPPVTADALSDLLRESEGLAWSAWLRRARTWARELEGSHS